VKINKTETLVVCVDLKFHKELKLLVYSKALIENHFKPSIIP
jgi:hypothetical protein